MAWPRPLKVIQPLELVVTVDDLQSNRAAEGDLAPNPGEDFHTIRLDTLPPAATVTALTPT